MTIKAENMIALENASIYLSDNELMEFDKYLLQYDIHLISFESHGPKASIDDISIFINQNITELMVAGHLMPAAYDVIKSTMKIIIYKIKEKVKILQSGNIREAVPCLKFKLKMER